MPTIYAKTPDAPQYDVATAKAELAKSEAEHEH